MPKCIFKHHLKYNYSLVSSLFCGSFQSPSKIAKLIALLCHLVSPNCIAEDKLKGQPPIFRHTHLQRDRWVARGTYRLLY